MEIDHNVEVIRLQEEHAKAAKEIDDQRKIESSKLSKTVAELQAELETLRNEFKGKSLSMTSMGMQ